MAGGVAGQRIVVTGGAGFIGVHSVEALLDAGAEVMVIDDLRHASYRPLPSAVQLENADIAEGPAPRLPRGGRPRSCTSPRRVASTAPGANRLPTRTSTSSAP
jgi:nucleoside-diphosphate-sugar epimerase